MKKVFEDATYLVLSDRAMGALIGISRGEARDIDYMPYTHGEDYFAAPEGTFNMPKKGLYPDR